ncbi:MAG TPA: MFS transporter, partial [Microbacterium sp.]|nr:MFS transporter [Microbacterium sp.]
RRDRARVRALVIAAGGFGVASVVSTWMPTYWTYAVVLIFVGFCTVTLLTTANGYVQTTTDPALRGRVLALYMAVVMGSTPIGAPIAGWITDAAGPRSAILVGGIAGLLAMIVGVTWMLASGRLRRSAHSRFRLTLDETLPISTVRVDPVEFSDEVAAATTPIRLPKPR